MIELEIKDGDTVDDVLADMWRKEPNFSKSGKPLSWEEFLLSLDGIENVKRDTYMPNLSSQAKWKTIIEFDSEQSKMFFLLKYS